MTPLVTLAGPLALVATPNVLDQARGTANEDEDGRRKANDWPVREVEERVRRGEILAKSIDREQHPDEPAQDAHDEAPGTNEVDDRTD